MPRLLLVDDNPSIHKIAETLLGSSSIELICVGSASEALIMLDSGDRFDVALLDTAMPGMDGWELLARMRKHPDTAYIPIAMMAGVLDTVDPEKLKHAPIQGFIKKPIELRELAERVQQLLATPVTLSEPDGAGEDPTVLSPFATVPGTKFKSLPELRDVVDGPPPLEIQQSATSHSDETNVQDDLLLLTPEDFWFEDAPVQPDSPDFLLAQATAQAMAKAELEPPVLTMGSGDSTLDLEELDLEALKDLPSEGPPPLPEVPGVPEDAYAQQSEEPFGEPSESPATAQAESDLEGETSTITGELSDEETLAISGPDTITQGIPTQEPDTAGFPTHEFLTEDMPAHALSELGEVPEFEDFALEITPAASPAPPVFEEAASHAGLNEESVFPSIAAYALPAAALALPAVSALHSETEAPAAPAPNAPLDVAAPSLTPVASDGEAQRDAAAMVQSLMSDPVLMDALAKALVARLGDQALREIAWELMPELAEKLPR